MNTGTLLVIASVGVTVLMLSLLGLSFSATGAIGLGLGHVGKVPIEVAVLLGAGAAGIVGIAMRRASRA